MAVKTLTSFTVKLGGVPLQVIADPTAETAEGDEPMAYSGTWEPLDSGLKFFKRDTPVWIRNFSRGAGFVEMRDESDDGGYAWGEDVFTHLGNGVTPSGRRVNIGIGLNLGLGSAVGQVIDSILFDGHLWCIDGGTRMFRYPAAVPTATPVYDPPLNTFASATGSFAAGYSAVAMAAFQTAAGVPALMVATANGGTYRLYQYTVAGGWATGIDLVAIDILQMKVLWWEGRDGAGALRLLVDTGSNGTRHCIAGSNPLLEASYVTPITLGNPSFPLRQILAAPQRALGICTNGIHDFNELRSWNVTPYWEETADGIRGIIYNDHVYGVRGAILDRYDLNLDGAQQRIPGSCGPMQYMQDGTPIQGTIRSLCTHDGWLLAMVENPHNKTNYLMRGADRRTVGVDIRNPMVWYGAEQKIPPVALPGSTAVNVYHMRITAGTDASWLWMFSTAAGANPDLYYAPLPTGSGPLAYQASGGTFAYNTTARLYFTAQTWDDRTADKGLHRINAVSRRATGTSYYEIYGRADADPTTILTDGTWTFQGKVDEDLETLVPAGISGHSIALHARWTNPSPYTAPAVLHELSPTARVVRIAPEIRTIWVVLERDHPLRDGTPDPRNPDTVFETIVNFQTVTTPIAYVDEKGADRTVYVEQGVKYFRVQVGEHEFRTACRLELTIT